MATSVVQKIANAGGVGIPVSLTTSMGATTTEGILLGATNTATAGAQVFSPSLHFQGSGWKTNATAAAMSCDYKVEIQPVQGAAAPANQLVFSYSTDGGAYVATLIPASGHVYGRVFTTENSLSCYSTVGAAIANTGGTRGVYIDYSRVGMASGAVCGWTSSATDSYTHDTGLSRISAGLLGVGTGAAGSFAGALKLTRIVTDPLTVGTLPASPSTGARCLVTDAASAAFYTVVATGGANVAPVFYDGTNWRVG